MKSLTGIVLFISIAGLTTVWAAPLQSNDTESKSEPSTADDSAAWNSYAASVEKTYDDYREKEQILWAEHVKRIKALWGRLAAFPEVKRYVDYSNQEHSRLRVDYESGEVDAEILVGPDEKRSSSELRSELAGVVTAAVSKKDGAQGILMLQELPGEGGTAIEKIASDLTAETLHGNDGTDRTIYRVSFKLVPDHIKMRAKAFQPLVTKWAAQYGLETAYVLAIIRQESAFNPRARSWVPAYGLMQIVPKYAGQEVMKTVTGKDQLPDALFLYDPEKNVMVGTAYLQLLRDQYFSEIKDPAKRLYLMTASYNWGPKRVRSALDSGRVPAQDAASQEVFDRLQQVAPEETRTYLRKVTQYAVEFKKEGF